MNLYIKFFFLLVKRLFNKRQLGLDDTSDTHFRVSLFDLDLNFHMNNGKFFSVMDLGRLDLLLRTGFFYKFFTNGYYPVVLSESIVFKSSLNLWQKYEVQTRIDSYDKNFFYMTQNFVSKKGLVASANVRACFKKRGRKGLVPPREIYEFGGIEFVERDLSPVAERQIELDNVLMPRDS